MKGLGRKKTQHVDLGSKGGFTVHKGALHRALGVPEDETIPASEKAIHKGDSPRLKRMKASAAGLAGMKK